MNSLSLAQLRMFDAVVSEGSLQAAASKLGRTHPTLHTTISGLEQSIGFKLFDRSGYRLVLTPEGAAFLERARRVLSEMGDLAAFAQHVSAGEESQLRVVVGDLSPLPRMLGLLKAFFAAHPQTRLHLQFETLSAPWELLAAEQVDLILHHVLEGDARFETIPLQKVSLIPVAAPGFLPFPAAEATIERMRNLTQCVIRDSAQNPQPRSYFLLDGAPTCTVGDQMMKREVILQGLGWGHMPDYLVADDLANGRLVSFTNRYFRGGFAELVAARRAKGPYGPIAAKLWDTLRDRSTAHPSSLHAKVKRSRGSRRNP
ncbi:MAG: LysR family transcriptional regulator [Bradyrhizobium sp.]|nr:MAG: LysR family transcriptional regulator [Bradyrhizobium sp.]